MRNKWTWRKAFDYVIKNGNNKGLTYWSAYDYLRHYSMNAFIELQAQEVI